MSEPNYRAIEQEAEETAFHAAEALIAKHGGDIGVVMAVYVGFTKIASVAVPVMRSQPKWANRIRAIEETIPRCSGPNVAPPSSPEQVKTDD